MHCCTSKHNWRWLFAVLLWGCSVVVFAGGISVNKSELRLADDCYRAAADFAISPTFVVEQALTHGIPLYFVAEFTLMRPRWYWLNEVVARGDQTTKLSYNMLTRQYRITRGTLFQNFDNLDDALQILNHQAFAPFSPTLVRHGIRYVAAVRLRLDVTQLPKPLQINALANTDWDLDSGWFRWDVTPEASKGAAESPFWIFD